MGIEVGVKVSNQNVLGTSMYDCRHCIDQRLSCTGFFLPPCVCLWMS